MLQVDKETFYTFLKQFIGGTYERITWSSPIRYNFYCGEEMLGYKYDSYGEDLPEYYIIDDKIERLKENLPSCNYDFDNYKRCSDKLIECLENQVKCLKFNKFRVIDSNGQMGWCLSFYDHFEILWDDGEYASWIVDLSVLGIEKLNH